MEFIPCPGGSENELWCTIALIATLIPFSLGDYYLVHIISTMHTCDIRARDVMALKKIAYAFFPYAFSNGIQIMCLQEFWNAIDFCCMSLFFYSVVLLFLSSHYLASFFTSIYLYTSVILTTEFRMLFFFFSLMIRRWTTRRMRSLW